jgi:ParB family transcriptional regulator, chromosome partitioning protein
MILNPTFDIELIDVGENIRKDTQMTPEFLSSIKHDGIMVPISIYPNPNPDAELFADRYLILDGQRRWLAAADAGMTTIPAIIVDPPSKVSSRVFDQLIANGQRAAISKEEDLGAIQLLADYAGVTASTIAKRTHRKKTEIEKTLEVLADPAAAKVFLEHHVDLTQAALIAEFADDPETVKELTQVAIAHPARLEHELASKRTNRTIQLETTRLVADIAAEGVLLVHRPQYDDRKTTEEKNLLDRVTGKKITAEEHASCEGRAAWVGAKDSWSKELPTIHYVCTDPTKHGHRSSLSNAPKGPLTDDEKAERRQARINTQLWEQATQVRQTWIAENLLARPTLPPEAITFVTTVMARIVDTHAYDDGLTMASQFLNINPSTHYHDPDVYIEWMDTHPSKHLHLALAIAISKYEMGLDPKKGWTVSTTHGKKGGDDLADYLAALHGWGYGLSELEDHIVMNTIHSYRSAPKSDEVAA